MNDSIFCLIQNFSLKFHSHTSSKYLLRVFYSFSSYKKNFMNYAKIIKCYKLKII